MLSHRRPGRLTLSGHRTIVMSMIGALFKSLRRPGGTVQRSWTPAELRTLIDTERLAEARAALAHLSHHTPHLDAERACLEGEILFRERRDAEAVAAFRRALADQPGMAAAHHGLSLILAEQGQLEDAVLHAQFAVQVDRSDPRYQAQAGYAHLRMDNFQAAEGPLRRATRLMAGNAYLWNNLGIVLRAKGDPAEARMCFEHAVRIKPDFDAARHHLAQLEQDIAGGLVRTVLSIDLSHGLQGPQHEERPPGLRAVREAEARGELQTAIDACEALELAHPDEPAVPVVLARLYERVGEADSARDVLMAHLSRHPGAAPVEAALGLVLLRMQQFVAAERRLEAALAQDDTRVDLMLGMSAALSGQERFEEAGPWIDRALALEPDNLSIVAQRAANLANRCRYEESLAIVEQLNAMGMSLAFKASVLGYLGRFDEALAALDADLAIHPRDPSLRMQRATINLLLGHYRQGWEDYAYRGHGASRDFRMLPFPVWHGGPLEGKRIIVLAEQGLGDQVMFASCLPDLLALGPAKVVVESNQRVARTLARSFPQCEVLATSQGNSLGWVRDHPDTDCFVHLGDLPGHFRREVSDFPVHTGYLHADPARVRHWREQLESRGPGPYIGMSWKGGTEMTRSPVRSMTPERFLPMARALPASTWVCLQYGEVEVDVARAAGAGLALAHWPEAIRDLDEFAALIMALDLVVTVCNTTVHYAGALGKPVWVLSPRVPEWRYGLHTDQMPWYPSSRMFRQRVDQNWQDPIDEICQKLSAWSAPDRAGPPDRPGN